MQLLRRSRLSRRTISMTCRKMVKTRRKLKESGKLKMTTHRYYGADSYGNEQKEKEKVTGHATDSDEFKYTGEVTDCRLVIIRKKFT